MNTGKTLFAQVMEFVPWTSFTRIVQRYNADSGVRRLNCAEQFRIMAFAQLTWRESLRDIEVTLGANSKKLYSMGFLNPVRKSTEPLLGKRLESMGRLSIFTHQESLETVRKRGSGFRARQHSLCIGLDNHRSVLEPVRLGSISHSQSSSQTAHTFRPQGLNTRIYTHQRRQDARSQCARHAHVRARSLLRNGQRLHRLSTPIQASPKWIILCDQSQEQFRCKAGLFTSRGQRQRSHLQSNHHAQRILQGTRVSRASQKNQIPRSTNRTNIDLLNKQYLITSPDHSGSIQESMASRGTWQSSIILAFDVRTFLATHCPMPTQLALGKFTQILRST